MIDMFMGEYNHTIDAKGRLIVPSKFREQLGDEFVVTKGLDGCFLCTITPSGKSSKRSYRHSHLPIRMPENSPVSFWQVPRRVRWIVRDESCFLRFCGILQTREGGCPGWRRKPDRDLEQGDLGGEECL